MNHVKLLAWHQSKRLTAGQHIYLFELSINLKQLLFPSCQVILYIFLHSITQTTLSHLCHKTNSKQHSKTFALPVFCSNLVFHFHLNYLWLNSLKICTVWIDKMVDTLFPYFQFPWRIELLAFNCNKYVCKWTFSSHHGSLAIKPIKGTLHVVFDKRFNQSCSQ